MKKHKIRLSDFDIQLFKDLESYEDVMLSGLAKKYHCSIEDVAHSLSKLEELDLCFMKAKHKKKKGTEDWVL